MKPNGDAVSTQMHNNIQPFGLIVMPLLYSLPIVDNIRSDSVITSSRAAAFMAGSIRVKL